MDRTSRLREVMTKLFNKFVVMVRLTIVQILEQKKMPVPEILM